MKIDIEKKKINGKDGGKIYLDIEDLKRNWMLKGIEDIGMKMEKEKRIEKLEEKKDEERKWEWWWKELYMEWKRKVE